VKESELLQIINEEIERVLLGEGLKSSILKKILRFNSNYVPNERLIMLLKKSIPINWDVLPDAIFKKFTPSAAKGGAGNGYLLFWLSTREKKNPDPTGYPESKVIEKNRLVSITIGDDFYLGGESSYYGLSRHTQLGINDVNHVASVSDEVYGFELKVIEKLYDNRKQRISRAAAKKGATALKPAREFAEENQKRYVEFMRKLVSDPKKVNKYVQDAIKIANRKYAKAIKLAGSSGKIPHGENPYTNIASAISENLSEIFGLYETYLIYVERYEAAKKEGDQYRTDSNERELKNTAVKIKKFYNSIKKKEIKK